MFLLGFLFADMFLAAWFSNIFRKIYVLNCPNSLASNSLHSAFDPFPVLFQVWDIQPYNCLWSFGRNFFGPHFWKFRVLYSPVHKSESLWYCWNISSMHMQLKTLCFWYKCFMYTGSLGAIFHRFWFFWECNNWFLLGKYHFKVFTFLSNCLVL